MNQLYEFANRVSRMSTWFGGGLLLLSAAIITVDVIVRKLFNVSMGGSDELAGYALAISTSWGLSFTLLSRANIRIDALYMRLPRSFKAWLDLIALITLGGFMTFVTWFTTQLWIESIDMGATANTPLQTPLWIPQGLWVAGFLVFLTVLAVLLVRVAGSLVQGDKAAVGAIAGLRSVEEEIEDEICDVRVHGHDGRSQHAV